MSELSVSQSSGGRFRISGSAVAILVIAFWVIVAVLAPLIAPYGEAAFAHDDSFLGPGQAGLLGSDYLGRDIFSRLAYGASRTLGLALLATAIGMVLGVGLGFLAAVLPRPVDTILGRFNDLAISLPSTMLALVIITGAGSSVPVLVLTVGFVEAMRVYRTARALAMEVTIMDYMDVARLRGESLAWIIGREILPNVSRPLLVEAGIRFTYSILFLSSLSFLGLGLQPPMADWGGMVRENITALLVGSPAALIPAAAIASVTLAVNFLVDSLTKGAPRGED